MANRINYNKVISQANDIIGLADDLSREISKLETLKNNICNNWAGPASEAFLKQLTQMIADMKITKSNMTSVASSIKSAANQIQQEDNTANGSC